MKSDFNFKILLNEKNEYINDGILFIEDCLKLDYSLQFKYFTNNELISNVINDFDAIIKTTGETYVVDIGGGQSPHLLYLLEHKLVRPSKIKLYDYSDEQLTFFKKRAKQEGYVFSRDIELIKTNIDTKINIPKETSLIILSHILHFFP